MDTRARHLLVEYRGCRAPILDEPAALEALMLEAADEAGATPVQTVFHRYAPHGVTGVVVIEESHFSLHTWPEEGYAAVDFYTCGGCLPDRAVEHLHQGLRAEHVESLEVVRGLHPPGPGLQVRGPATDVTDPPPRKDSP